MRDPLPQKGKGLVYCIHKLGIQSVGATQCHKLTGIATDGTSANIAGGGLKGLVVQKLTWIFWMWFLAHRTELTIKDALTGTAFDAIASEALLFI